jgi:hypothetical protein
VELSGCPDCGEGRIGVFRFCRGCGFDFDDPRSTTDDGARDATTVPFDLFPRQAPDVPMEGARGAWSPDGVGTGILLVAGIVGAFLALLYFRPLG